MDRGVSSRSELEIKEFVSTRGHESLLQRFGEVDFPNLEWNEEVEASTAHLYQRVEKIVPAIEWPTLAPYVHAINELKKKRNAVIIAHNYQSPEIFNCVADMVGDSLQLAIMASECDADVIIQGGVHFMAETSKLMNPDKTVLIPDLKAGCSLAESIQASDVRKLRTAHPGVPVVTYVNTSVDVKAESDICCTSSNVVDIVNGLGVPKVILIPDEFLAKYVQTLTDVEIITWQGHCEVHERFTSSELQDFRDQHPGIKILAHPECPPDVISMADFTGSTAHMARWVKEHQPKKVVMVTECSMAANVSVGAPQTEFIQPCNMCPHMKRITLPKILDSLVYLRNEIVIEPALQQRARQAIENMISFQPKT